MAYPEPPLTMLMPISMTLAWAALLADRLDPRTALHVAKFYWLWALKNCLYGPLRGDAGVFTFAAYWYVRRAAWSAASLGVVAIVVGANYAVPVFLFALNAIVAGIPPWKLARTLRKSERWVRVFRAYCAAGLAYWVVIAWVHFREAARPAPGIRP